MDNYEYASAVGVNALINAADSLEQMQLQAEQMAGITRICSAAFDNEESYSIIRHEDVAGTFYNLNINLQDLTQQIKELTTRVFIARNQMNEAAEIRTGYLDKAEAGKEGEA